jgi:hypothetical protein
MEREKVLTETKSVVSATPELANGGCLQDPVI